VLSAVVACFVVGVDMPTWHNCVHVKAERILPFQDIDFRRNVSPHMIGNADGVGMEVILMSVDRMLDDTVPLLAFKLSLSEALCLYFTFTNSVFSRVLPHYSE